MNTKTPEWINRGEVRDRIGCTHIRITPQERAAIITQLFHTGELAKALRDLRAVAIRNGFESELANQILAKYDASNPETVATTTAETSNQPTCLELRSRTMKNQTVESIALALHTEGSHNHRPEITGPIKEIPTYSELRARGELLAEAVRRALKLEESLGMARNPISIQSYKDALAVWEAAQ